MLRGREAALAVVNSLPETPSLSVITATELIAGVHNARERRQIERLLEVYVPHDNGLETASLAGDHVRRYGPSHGVDPIDALIAATAKILNLELAPLNLKHFPMIDTPKRPYRK